MASLELGDSPPGTCVHTLLGQHPLLQRLCACTGLAFSLEDDLVILRGHKDGIRRQPQQVAAARPPKLRQFLDDKYGL